MKKYILIILTCLMMVGCSTTGMKLRQVERINQKIDQQEQVIQKHSKAYVDGVIKALNKIPVDKQIPEVKLALRLANNTQTLLGKPEPDLEVNTDKLLGTNLDDKRFEEKRLLDIEVAGKKSLEEKLKLTREKDDLEKQLLQDLAKRVEKERQSFWFKVKFWGAALLLGAGVFMLCIQNPALIPSVISKCISFVMGCFSAIGGLITKR